jgi:hypothetical protein
LVEHVCRLRKIRDRQKESIKREGRKRAPLGKKDRAVVFAKTDGRCHICGGEIEGRWQADHVMAHSAGGNHHVDNYLPAHATCNNYRWDYLADEFALILKLGVWARTEIERQTAVGAVISQGFAAKERARIKRTKDWQGA